MAKFRVSLCQTLGGMNKTENLRVAREAIEAVVKKDRPQIVALPECFNSPYDTKMFPKYAEKIPSSSAECNAVDHPSMTMLSTAAKAFGIFLIGGSIPEVDGDKVYNTCVVFNGEGEMVARHRKAHLFDIDVPGKITFKESETLTAGDAMTTFDTPWCKVGVAICYDMRFSQLASLMRDEGCKLLVYPGAFNMTTGPAHWELLQRARAVDNQLYVTAVSPARNPESTYQAWGHSTIVSPWGEVLSTMGHEPGSVTAELDIGRVDEIREMIPILSQRRLDMYNEVQVAQEKPSIFSAATK